MRGLHDLTVALRPGPLEERHSRGVQRHLGLGLRKVAVLLPPRLLGQRDDGLTLAHGIVVPVPGLVEVTAVGAGLQQALGAEVAVDLGAAAGSAQRLLGPRPPRPRRGRVPRDPGAEVGHPQLVVQLLGRGPGQPQRHLLLGGQRLRADKLRAAGPRPARCPAPLQLSVVDVVADGGAVALAVGLHHLVPAVAVPARHLLAHVASVLRVLVTLGLVLGLRDGGQKLGGFTASNLRHRDLCPRIICFCFFSCVCLLVVHDAGHTYRHSPPHKAVAKAELFVCNEMMNAALIDNFHFSLSFV